MPAGPGESEVARQDASETIRVRRLIKEVGRHLTHVDPLRILHVLVDHRRSSGGRDHDWRFASLAARPAPQHLSARLFCFPAGHGWHDLGSRVFGQPCVDVVWGDFIGYDDVRDV